MICIAAFLILAVIGIFSAPHRELAKEAFDCVLHRVTFRPCQSSFQTKVKSGALNWLMKRNMKAASFFNKYSELFAWIFVIFTIASLIYSGFSLYNYFIHGSCTPQNPTQCTLNKISLLERIRLKFATL